MQAISLYWFASQQQTSTPRRQKFALFYPKHSAEFNEPYLNLFLANVPISQFLSHARFGAICTIQKTGKTPMEECYF